MSYFKVDSTQPSFMSGKFSCRTMMFVRHGTDRGRVAQGGSISDTGATKRAYDRATCNLHEASNGSDLVG